ncbi:MAG: FAD-dependent monooxygenase [Paracoccaceae bacterium]
MTTQTKLGYATSLATKNLAVIGGGIGGVAAALALAQRGANVQLFEQAAALGEVGAGLQISPNGVAVLAALGLKDSAASRASAPDTAELRNAAGARVATILLGAQAEARYGQPYWQFHRADLLDVLAKAAGEAGVQMHFGHAAQAGPDGIVHRGGATQQFDAIIAADGVHSIHRAQHFGGQNPQFLNHVAWRATVPADGLPPEAVAKAARIHMGPGRHLVSYPLRGGRIVNLVGIVKWVEWVGESWSQQGDGDGFRAAFARFGGDVPALLARVETCYRWGLFGHAPVAQWAKGRLALLGDACHPTLPFLAQGATQALEDAWALAACLAGVQTVEAGLTAYQAARKRRADKIVAAAAQSGKIYHIKQPLVRGVAHMGMRGMSALAPGLLQRRFDWIYGARPYGL